MESIEDIMNRLVKQACDEIDEVSADGGVDRHYCQDKVIEYIRKTLEEVGLIEKGVSNG